jgi:hypothetical protein
MTLFCIKQIKMECWKLYFGKFYYVDMYKALYYSVEPLLYYIFCME